MTEGCLHSFCAPGCGIPRIVMIDGLPADRAEFAEKNAAYFN